MLRKLATRPLPGSATVFAPARKPLSHFNQFSTRHSLALAANRRDARLLTTARRSRSTTGRCWLCCLTGTPRRHASGSAGASGKAAILPEGGEVDRQQSSAEKEVGGEPATAAVIDNGAEVKGLENGGEIDRQYSNENGVAGESTTTAAAAGDARTEIGGLESRGSHATSAEMGVTAEAEQTMISSGAKTAGAQFKVFSGGFSEKANVSESTNSSPGDSKPEITALNSKADDDARLDVRQSGVSQASGTQMEHSNAECQVGLSLNTWEARGSTRQTLESDPSRIRDTPQEASTSNFSRARNFPFARLPKQYGGNGDSPVPKKKAQHSGTMSQAFKDVDACFGSSDSKQVALDAFLKLKETKALQTWTPTHFKLLLERMLVGPWVDEDRIAIIDDTRADLGIKANHEYRWRLAGVYADTDAAIVRAREEHQRGLDILRKAYEQNPSLALNRRVMRKELQGKRYKSVRWLLRLEETVKAALEEYPTSHCDRFLDLMFKAIARRRDVPLLEKWMSIVRHSSVRPGPAAYSAIIDAYGETGNLSQAENWYHNFLKTTLPKQETVFVAYANALVRGGKVKEARVFLEELIETTLEMKISRPTYTALIKIFILDNDAESAQIFVRKLENRNKPGVPPPDGNMYAAILECALENDYYAFSQRLVEKLMRYPFHWAHNSRLLSSYGELAIKNGDLDAALAVYHQLYGCNAIPHPDFTRALVQALTHADRRGDVFDMLGNLLTKLRRRRDLSQLKHRRDKNWTVLIRQIVQFDDTDFDLLLLAHEVILRSYTPHMFDLTGRALIAAYDRVREGRGPISRKLVAEDFLTIYHALFFSHMPSAEIAARVLVYLDDMNRAGLQPTNHIDELVRKGLARCSPSLPEEATKWRLSIAAGPPPRSGPAEEPKKIMVRTPEHTRPRAPLATLHSFDKQIGDLCERGHRTEAMILLRYIGSDGQMPSPHVYGQLVHLCTRERDFKSLDYLFGMYKQLFRQSDTADRGDLQMLTEYEGHLAKGTLLAHLESEKHGGQVITVLDIYKSMASMKALFGYNPYGVKDYEQLFEAIYDRAERKQVPALRGPQDVQALMSAYKEFRALTASSVPEDDVPRQTHLANTHLTLLHILIATDRTQAAITVFNDIVNIPNIESYIDTGMIYHAILTHLATTPSRTRQMLTHTAVALYYKYIGAHADAAPDPRLVNAMILVYGAAGNQDGLDRMFRLAAYRDVRIPPETCNTLLATLAKSTDLQYANLVKVRRKVEEMGYTLTAGTYEALIAYLTSVRRRDLAEAERVYAEMLQRGLAPTKRVLEDLVAAALESRPRGYTDTRPAPPPPTDALAKARVYRAACVAAHGTSTMKLDSAILTHLLGVLRDYDAAKEMYRRMEVRHRSPKVYAAVVRAAVDASRGVFVKMEQTSQGSGDDSTQADDTTPAASDGDSAATRMQTQTQAQIHHDPETELRFARTVLDEMKTAKRGTPAVNLIAQCEAMVVEREREVERAGRVVGDVGWA